MDYHVASSSDMYEMNLSKWHCNRYFLIIFLKQALFWWKHELGYQLLPLPTYLLMILSQTFCIELLFFEIFIYGNKCIGCSNVLMRDTCVFAELEKNVILWIMSFKIKLASPYCNKVLWKTNCWVRFYIVYIADPSL